MGTTITLRNIPDEIHDSLRQTAEAHHLSLNGEVIAWVRLPGRTGPDERLVRDRQIRESLAGKKLKAAAIAKAIAQGRP